VGAVVASTLDRETIVQKVTDIATALTRAEFGAFFYNVTDPDSSDAYMLYALSGAPVRLDDVTADPRYGKSAPYHGMPEGHVPVCSDLAVPVKGVHGDVLGGLFFGHSHVGVFNEQLALGVASGASVALENARLYADARMSSRWNYP
jgi:GAF domain-containing protein